MMLNDRLQSNERWVLLLILVLFLFAVFASSGDEVGLPFGMPKTLNEGWTIYHQGEVVGVANLPREKRVPTGDAIAAQRVLPEDFEHRQTIRLRSSMADMKVYLDGKLLYEGGTGERQRFPHIPEASLWIFLDIPEASQGKVLRIETASAIRVMSGRINDIVYGSPSELVGEMMAGQRVPIIMTLFILSTGLLSFLAVGVIGFKNANRLHYLGIFSLSGGLWLLSEMDLFQLFTTNQYLVGTISYVLLPVAIWSFIKFMVAGALERYRRIMATMGWCFILYLLMSMVLQMFYGVNYITLWPLLILMLIGMILVVYGLLIYEYRRFGTTDALKYLFFVSVLILAVLTEGILFLTGRFMTISSYSNLGIGLFLLLLVVDTLKHVSLMQEKEGEARYLEEIAYKDPLTGGGNRAAFEKTVDRLLAEGEKTTFRLTMFDLNNLKQINDVHGHKVGDMALEDFYEGLTQAYDNDAKAYRIGGDEFMVIQYNVQEGYHQRAMVKLEAFMAEKGLERGYHFKTACGSAVYDHSIGFGDFKHRVDMAMYANKKQIKSEMGI